MLYLKEIKTKGDEKNHYKTLYGFNLDPEDNIYIVFLNLKENITENRRFFDSILLNETKMIKPGKFSKRKRQASKLIGKEIKSSSWDDLLRKISNIYNDFFLQELSYNKEDLYNNIKISCFKTSSRLEGIDYNNQTTSNKTQKTNVNKIRCR